MGGSTVTGIVLWIVYVVNSPPVKYIHPQNGAIEAVQGSVFGGKTTITANFNNGDTISLPTVVNAVAMDSNNICTGQTPKGFEKNENTIIYRGSKKRYNIVATCGEGICGCKGGVVCCEISITPA